MNQVLMYILAAGVILGGIDRLLGNKWGYGKRMEEGFLFMGPTALSMVGIMCLVPFLSDTLGKVIVPLFELFHIDPGKRMEEGFLFMGPTALSMVGIMCLVPFLSDTLGKVIVPLFELFHIDPAMFGGFLPIDMGGYQLAKSLETSASTGNYAGIIVSATFGCTLVFTIPVGMGLIENEDRSFFAEGLLIGLVTLPLGLIFGAVLCGVPFLNALWQTIPVFLLSIFLGIGLKYFLLIGLVTLPLGLIFGAVLCGVPFLNALWQTIPVFLLSIFLGIGLKYFPAKIIRGFGLFASGLKAIITIGLVLGAVTYLTGISILPNLSPIQDALCQNYSGIWSVCLRIKSHYHHWSCIGSRYISDRNFHSSQSFSHSGCPGCGRFHRYYHARKLTGRRISSTDSPPAICMDRRAFGNQCIQHGRTFGRRCQCHSPTGYDERYGPSRKTDQCSLYCLCHLHAGSPCRVHIEHRTIHACSFVYWL